MLLCYVMHISQHARRVDLNGATLGDFVLVINLALVPSVIAWMLHLGASCGPGATPPYGYPFTAHFPHLLLYLLLFTLLGRIAVVRT